MRSVSLKCLNSCFKLSGLGQRLKLSLSLNQVTCTSTSNALGRPSSSLPNSEQQWLTVAHHWMAQQGVQLDDQHFTWPWHKRIQLCCALYRIRERIVSAKAERCSHSRDLLREARQEACLLQLTPTKIAPQLCCPRTPSPTAAAWQVSLACNSHSEEHKVCNA